SEWPLGSPLQPWFELPGPLVSVEPEPLPFGVPCAPPPCVSPLLVLHVAVLPPSPFAPFPSCVCVHEYALGFVLEPLNELLFALDELLFALDELLFALDELLFASE